MHVQPSLIVKTRFSSVLQTLGKSRLKSPWVAAWLCPAIAPDNLEEVLAENRFSPLSITIAHAVAVSQLPHHHNDPFDRILAAQAKVERLTIVTHDKYLKMYDIPFITA